MRSALKTMRAASVGLVIISLIFSLGHWPGHRNMLIGAWLVAALVLTCRAFGGMRQFLSEEGARDVFTMGMISVFILRKLHLPGGGYALGLALLGGVAFLYFKRHSFIPGRSDNMARPWLFYVSLGLVLTGTIFRIQHWPYSSEMLFSGLIATAICFFASLRIAGKRP